MLGFASNLILKLAVLCSKKRVFYYPEFQTKIVKFKGIDVRIPVDAEKHLLLMYGHGWRIPIKDDVAGKEFVIKEERHRKHYRLPEVEI